MSHECSEFGIEAFQMIKWRHTQFTTLHDNCKKRGQYRDKAHCWKDHSTVISKSITFSAWEIVTSGKNENNDEKTR